MKGSDILGAAKTGSGKTLAFLVPVLENLYRQQWSQPDGLGALIISPTRELAIQIYEVLRKIGRYHSFSAGLIIGGDNLQEERERVGKMNILVCTPGRMLQHMGQTPDFNVDNLQMLVLDEADRIMDMGFQKDVDAIIEYLPKEKQTMLFSATQTKRVSDLARLSLRDSEYVAVHESADSATPTSLKQHYVICPLGDKLNTLYSFIKSASKSKMIVFLSSGKQVRFVFETFRHLRPGIPLLHLHGRQKQGARLRITDQFSKSKNACIFATDVVARGLDFPAVDWVVQYDCPEDADTYIHRVGRTARYGKAGQAILILDPSEEPGMLKRLEHKKVPIKVVKVTNDKAVLDLKNQLQNICFQFPELKYLGQKAFKSYTQSLFIQKDKEIFDLEKYDLEGYAASMGLPGAPKIKFQKGDDAKKVKNAPRAALSSDDESDEDATVEKAKKEVRTKYDRMFERRNQNVLSGHYNKMIDGEDTGLDAEADEDNDFFPVKRILPVDDEDSSSDEGEAGDIAADGPKAKVIRGDKAIVIDSKKREKLLTSKKQIAIKLAGTNKQIRFDEDGNPHERHTVEGLEEFNARGPAADQRAKFVEEEASKIREADVDDKQLEKQKKREKKEKRKARELAESEDDDEDMGVELAGGEEDADPEAFQNFLKSLPPPEEKDRSDERPPKRPKKWFEDDSEDEEKKARKGRFVEAEDEPETLEDLEALASGLLG